MLHLLLFFFIIRKSAIIAITLKNIDQKSLDLFIKFYFIYKYYPDLIVCKPYKIYK